MTHTENTMQTAMEAKHNGVEFTRSALRPLNSLRSAGINFVRFWESVGRARAAHHLYRMGYHEQAKNLILGIDKK